MSETGQNGAAADSGGPAAVIGNFTAALTDEQLSQLAREWTRQFGRAIEPSPFPPPPRRVRLRLAATHVIDRVAIRLADRGCHGAAGRLWRAFGIRRS